MLRSLVAALYLLTIPGTAAWAQTARIVRSPLPLSAPPAVLPTLAAPLTAAPSLTAASLSGPALAVAPALVSAALPAASVPAAAAVPAPAAALVPASAAAAALAESAPTSLSAVRAVASASSELSSRTSGAESDFIRADFADGLRATAGRALGVLAAAPRRWISGLAPRQSAAAPARGNVPVPSTPKPAGPRLGGYLYGTFGSQLAANALQVTMPLLFLKLTGSAAAAAFAVAIGSAFDAAGTLVGGWLTDKVQARPVLIVTTVARGLAMAALPALALTGTLTLPAVAAAYLVECFSRGVADTARSTLPSELSGRDEGLLNRILSKNQIFYEAGGTAGPFIAGALIVGLGGVASVGALWLAPAVFAAVELAYWTIPKTAMLSSSSEPARDVSAASKPKVFDGWMRSAMFATALLTLYPLKGLLPAIFAAQVLHDPASAAWLAGLFGVGGLAGALAYSRWWNSVGARTWLVAGGLGGAALAAAFLPGAFWPAALGVLAFSAANVAARLALNAAIQTRAAGRAGVVMGGARFAANLSGMAVRFLAGLAFTATMVPGLPFWIIGGGIAAAAAASVYYAGELTGTKTSRLAWIVAGAALIAAGAHFFVASGALALPAVAFGAGTLGGRTRLFDKDPAGDSAKLRRNYLNEKRGVHFYFRNMLQPMQQRFAELMSMSAMPRVFLHGNPHLDQYSKSAQGAAMVDFDRSRYGPYAWDLLRVLVSVSLRQKKPVAGLLDPDAIAQLKKGYLRGFRHPEREFAQASDLKDVAPAPGEATTNAYLKANYKWAAEMRANPLPPDSPDVVALLDGYLKSRGEKTEVLAKYKVEEAGRGFGSMGNDRVFIVLAPRAEHSRADRILLEIKRTYHDADTQWYKNPFPHDGERMIAATALYAPGWELMPGYATLRGVQYYGHRLATQNLKLKKMLKKEQQADFLYAVGSQLGRAHRLSLLDGATPDDLEKHLDEHFDEIVAAALTMRNEIADAHARYLRRMKREGRVPRDDEDAR